MVWTIPSYKVSYYTDNVNDREKLLSLKREVLFERIPVEDGLKFPGFFGENKDFFTFYVDRLYNVFTSPRGNLIDGYAIIGFAPGDSIQSFGEPKWLLGPSSQTLHRLLTEFEIYPYFTNVFKKPFRDNRPDYSHEELTEAIEVLLEELQLLSTDKIILLGKYSEYQSVIDLYKEKPVKIIQIHHPSYVNRVQKYDEWATNFHWQLLEGERE